MYRKYPMYLIWNLECLLSSVFRKYPIAINFHFLNTAVSDIFRAPKIFESAIKNLYFLYIFIIDIMHTDRGSNN